MQTKKISDLLLNIAFFGIIFIFLFIYFTVIHPLTVYDTDDWYYLANVRAAIPLWGYFNPVKILPETSLALITHFGVYIINPFIHDFLRSVSLAAALFVCFLITIYLFSFEKLCILYMGNEKSSGLTRLLTLIFLCLHFLIFLRHDTGNYHLFYSNNICNYYHYMVPALFNCSLVMLFLRTDMQAFFESNEISHIKKGSYLIIIYLAIFSSIQLNAITAVFVGSILIKKFAQGVSSKITVRNYCRSSWLFLSILVTFFVSLVFESSGGRAGDIAKSSFRGRKTLISFASLILPVNKKFLILVIFFLGLGIFSIATALTSKEKRSFISDIIWEALLPMIFLTIYLFVLCTVSKPSYMGRPDTIFGIAFYGFLIVFRFFMSGLKSFPKLSILIPLISLIAAVYTVGGLRSFREPNIAGISPSKCTDISQNLIDQLKDAELQGLSEYSLKVPKYDTKDNWPYPSYSGDVIQSVLYKYGVLNEKMTVTTVVDESLNSLLGSQ